MALSDIALSALLNYQDERAKQPLPSERIAPSIQQAIAGAIAAREQAMKEREAAIKYGTPQAGTAPVVTVGAPPPDTRRRFLGIPLGRRPPMASPLPSVGPLTEDQSLQMILNPQAETARESGSPVFYRPASPNYKPATVGTEQLNSRLKLFDDLQFDDPAAILTAPDLTKEDLRGAKPRAKIGGVSAAFTQAQLDAIAAGDAASLTAAFPTGVPIDAARLAASNNKERGVQGRADERLRQSQNTAAAKETVKAKRAVGGIEEGRGFIQDLVDRHSALVKNGMAGDPVRASAAGALAKVTGGGAGTADVKAYDDVKRGLIARLKRVTGDSGVLTETDADRLEGLLPSRGESPKVVRSKQVAINHIFDLAESGETEALSSYLTTLGVKKQATGKSGAAPKKVMVSNGKETLLIDAADEADAKKDGFRRVK